MYFFSRAFFLGMIAIILAIIMMIMIGLDEGALSTSFQAIRGDLVKHYQDSDSIYFIFVISYLNTGHMIGYLTVGLLLMFLGAYLLNFG